MSSTAEFKRLEEIDDSPLTDEECERLDATIARLRKHREALLAARGGQPFQPAWKTLDEVRTARTKALS